MTDDLREQIARVLLNAHDAGGRFFDSVDLADAVLAVVQPVIERGERKVSEIALRCADLTLRAEQAERERDLLGQSWRVDSKLLQKRVATMEAARRAARFVAEHWRDAALAVPSDSPARIMAHPLNLVMDALDGETDPVRLGISPDARDAFRAALGEQDTADDEFVTYEQLGVEIGVRCPTCWDEDATRTEPPLVMGPMQTHYPCPDPWHSAAPPVEGEQ